MIESCGKRWHNDRAVLAISPVVWIEISQPTQKQGPVVTAHQFLAHRDELVDKSLAFFPPPPPFFVTFPPNNAPVADFFDRQCVLVLFAAAKIWLDRLP